MACRVDLDLDLPPRIFDRKRFSSKDCFTGQSPGMWARTMGAGGLSEDLTDGRGVAFKVVTA